MIELPRAAVCADQIAPHADFFSFGTNDLTQTDARASRATTPRASSCPPTSRTASSIRTRSRPSTSTASAGSCASGCERGRGANPALGLGVCGEHGGDPASIAFFHTVGLDYVSCSPFRVPAARLAAAQAVLGGGFRDR